MSNGGRTTANASGERAAPATPRSTCPRRQNRAAPEAPPHDRHFSPWLKQSKNFAAGPALHPPYLCSGHRVALRHYKAQGRDRPPSATAGPHEGRPPSRRGGGTRRRLGARGTGLPQAVKYAATRRVTCRGCCRRPSSSALFSVHPIQYRKDS